MFRKFVRRANNRSTHKRTMWATKKTSMVSPDKALPGRATAMKVNGPHFILKNSIQAPFPPQMQTCIFGTGCFWGTEKGFWRLPGVHATAVGYAGGYTKNP